MIDRVKKITLDLFRRVPCSSLAGLLTVAHGRGLSPAAHRFVSASAAHEAELRELSAASTAELVLVDGKAPEWITLVPAGVFSLVDGRGPFRNFDPEAIISASIARAGKTELPGDYDHHMDLPPSAGVKGLASGWIKELKAEGGAVRARVKWTSAGRAHLEAGEYRYVSPRFAQDADGNVLFLVRFALTNKPAIVDLPAIAAHATQHPAHTSVHNRENDVNLLQRLLGALAISASVTEDQAVDLVRQLAGKVNDLTKAAGLTSAAAADEVVAALRKVDPANYVSAAEHQTVVAERDKLRKDAADANTARLAAEISAAVEAGVASGQVVPAAKDTWIKLCTSAASVDPVKEFLKTAPVVVPKTTQGAGTPPAGGEISAAAVEADPEMMALCRQFGITPERFAEQRNAETRAARAAA